LNDGTVILICSVFYRECSDSQGLGELNNFRKYWQAYRWCDSNEKPWCNFEFSISEAGNANVWT